MQAALSAKALRLAEKDKHMSEQITTPGHGRSRLWSQISIIDPLIDTTLDEFEGFQLQERTAHRRAIRDNVLERYRNRWATKTTPTLQKQWRPQLKERKSAAGLRNVKDASPATSVSMMTRFSMVRDT